jgi:hypothetical protein
VVHGEGVRVRGVWYEATIPWRELHDVSVEPSGWAVRALVWGVMQPRTLRLRTSTRTLRPLAAVSHDGDDELDRALGAMRVRLGAWGVPAQRQPEAGVDSRA